MAYKLVHRISLVRGLTPTQKFVLMQLGSYCNRYTKVSRPGNDFLAADTGFNKRTIRRTLAELIEMGFLIVHKRPRQQMAAEYRFGDDVIDSHARPTRRAGLDLDDGDARGDTEPPLAARGDTESPLSPRGGPVSARGDSLSVQRGHRVPPTRKEPDRTLRGRARAQEARPPAPEPEGRRQGEILLPIDGGGAARDGPRERLAAARAALEAMPDDDPMRQAQEAIVARIEREVDEEAA